jgi:CelD/BcsL family acetyltransferase involved in cellulose biosynthesis
MVDRLELERVGALEPLRETWTRLALAQRNVFATWEFADVWWRGFGRGRPLHVYACRRRDDVVSILPLYSWRARPLHVLRFVGAPEGDELGPIHGGADGGELADAVATALRRASAQVLLAEHVTGESGWPERLRGRPLRREGYPVLRHEGGWDAYLGDRSRNFRSTLGRAERRLAAEGAVFRLTTAATLERDLDSLFRLHAARWGADTPFLRAAAFHREFARAAIGHGWLRLWVVEVGGAAIAAWHGYRFAGVESYYQSGRDPSWERFRLGTLLVAHSIREAMYDGIGEYRFLRGDEPYKYRFTDEDPGLLSFGISRGAAGAGAVAALALAVRGRRLARSARPSLSKLRRS